MRATLAAAAIHVGFAAAFAALLLWRPPAPAESEEKAVEVSVVPDLPQDKPTPPKPDAPKPALVATIPQPAPDPHPPAPPVVQPPPVVEPPRQADQPKPADQPVSAETKAVEQGQAAAPSAPDPNPLRAPPPEPVRAQAQVEGPKPPNLEPEPADAPKAAHEPKPLEAPKVLATADPRASFAVPRPADPPQAQAPAPAPDAPRAPNETEKLAAALPMDTSAMPASFRAVLSGNGAAVDAAYKGLVYGRFSHAAEIGERARRLRLKGQVIVAFTIGDDGGIRNLAVLQSSGSAQVDALGLEMIRSAAPFPPPPPGAQHSFTPALTFGG